MNKPKIAGYSLAFLLDSAFIFAVWWLAGWVWAVTAWLVVAVGVESARRRRPSRP